MELQGINWNLVKHAQMNEFHCEQMGFDHTEDPLRSCRTHLWVFYWASEKPEYLYPDSLAYWLKIAPEGVKHLSGGLNKHLPSNSDAQRWECWRCKEVSLHEHCPPQLQVTEVSWRNVEWSICSINHTPLKEFVFIFSSDHQLPFMRYSERSRSSVHSTCHLYCLL